MIYAVARRSGSGIPIQAGGPEWPIGVGSRCAEPRDLAVALQDAQAHHLAVEPRDPFEVADSERAGGDMEGGKQGGWAAWRSTVRSGAEPAFPPGRSTSNRKANVPTLAESASRPKITSNRELEKGHA